MKVVRKVNDELIREMPKQPPEIGGILGGHDGIVDVYAVDIGIQNARMCSYTPDVDRLNSIIEQWQEKDIEFMGVFHTHFFGVDTLSEPDMAYMSAILKAMPEDLKSLYFPLLVMPNGELVAYLAFFDGENLVVQRETTELV